MSKRIASYVRDFEYSSLSSYFEAVIDGEGEYKLSGISPDMVYAMTMEFAESRFSDRDRFVYSDLGYDMHGKPGRVVIEVRKNRMRGSYDIKTEWHPMLFL